MNNELFGAFRRKSLRTDTSDFSMKILRFSKLIVLLSVIFYSFFSVNAQEKLSVYSNRQFTFKYPSNFSVQVRNNKIRLFHFVKFRYTDPCDESDKPQIFNNLIDFDTTFEINSKTPKFSDADFTTDKWEELPFGSVDTGNLKGEVKELSVEGCGEFDYSFAFKTFKTLLVKRQIIGMFSPAALNEQDYKKAVAVKGVINSEKEKRIFKSVVESIKIK